jgi:hypothetical protein
VGEGVRGSRDKRFARSSSSYGTSMITKVGTFDLDESAIWAIWSRQDLPEAQMETGGRGG